MGPLTWQHDGLFKQDLQLLTARKKTVAVIRDAKLPRGNVMVIGIVAGDIAPQGIFEEILFSALAVLEWRRRIGCVGGLGMVDAKRMTRSLVAAVAGFPGQLLKGKTQKKKEGDAGRRTRAETGNETGRITGEGFGDGQEGTEETGEDVDSEPQEEKRTEAQENT